MTKDLYRVLGLDKSATAQEIKRAYRKKSMENHPDKGGDEKKFRELAEAYKVLSDESSRARYDQCGHIDMGVDLHSVASSVIVEHFSSVIRNFNPDIKGTWEVNVVEKMVELLHQDKQKHEESHDRLKKQLKIANQLLKRLRHQGNNFGPILINHINFKKDEIIKAFQQVKLNKKTTELAFQIMEEYEYESDLKTPILTKITVGSSFTWSFGDD